MPHSEVGDPMGTLIGLVALAIIALVMAGICALRDRHERERLPRHVIHPS